MLNKLYRFITKLFTKREELSNEHCEDIKNMIEETEQTKKENE